MGEKSNTLEQRNASQANTIAKQVEQIKGLKAQVDELNIWKRFVEFLISDCNMQPAVMEQFLGDMLEKEAKEPALRSHPVDASSITEPAFWKVGESPNLKVEGWYAHFMVGAGQFGPFATKQECTKSIKNWLAKNNQ